MLSKTIRPATHILKNGGILFPCINTTNTTIIRNVQIQTQQEPKALYNVGIFGCGRIADTHLKNVLKNRRMNLKWIVENNASRVKEVQRAFNIGDDIKFYDSQQMKRILQDKSLDAVLVLSPTNTHTEYICESLSHGKSVFSEKPAGESTADIKQCYETAEKFGVPFLTGYCRRFDPAFCDVKGAVASGVLGTVQTIKCTTRDSPKPSYEFLKNADNTGCNILSDLAVHDIDMLVWLTGARRPESIYVSCHAHDPELQASQQPDSMAALIKYPDGILVTMDTFRDSVYGYDIRLEVFGSKGMALAENPRESSTVIDGHLGGSARRLYNSFPQRFGDAFEGELRHFVDCMDGHTSPLVTKEESVVVAEIIEKGIESYKSGEISVRVWRKMEDITPVSEGNSSVQVLGNIIRSTH